MSIWKTLDLLLVCFAFASVNALDCISCKWTAENDTLDNNCLNAPYKMAVITCPKPASSDQLYFCTTEAVFENEQNVMGLESLERTCGLKHSRCNNACAQNTAVCWQCCNDHNSCNSFPLRGNIVYVSSAVSGTRTGSQLVVAMLFAFSFGYISLHS